MRASQMSKKEMNKTSNFERLSGLITQSHSNERKARLIEHYKKIKQQRWEERGQQPWAADQHLREEGGEVRASLTNNISPPTPGIASGCLRTLISDRDTHLKVNKICSLASQSVKRRWPNYQAPLPDLFIQLCHDFIGTACLLSCQFANLRIMNCDNLIEV